MSWRVEQADCVEAMAKMPDGSIDAVVTDPPYNLSFMAKPWDCHDGREDAGFAYWLAGLIDGEGHFAIKAHTRGSHAPAFALKMRADEEGTLRMIQRTLQIGSVGYEKRREGSPMVRWVVQDKAGCQRLVDLLDKYPLRAKKRIDYLTWREAVCEWTGRGRGNRWHGAASNARMAHLREQLMTGRRYAEPAWSGHEFQDWCRLWATEALRVLKPGGHALVFGGTRTFHRLTAGLEDAGFEIRDTLAYLFGSGFPKSMDVSKAIDKAAGAERQVVGSKVGQPGYSTTDGNGDHRTYGRGLGNTGDGEAECAVTAPATPEAERWQGWGTALKPAFEPVVVARKPLVGTVAGNVLEHGTGAINVDGCRVATADDLNGGAYSPDRQPSGSEWVAQGGTIHSFTGREYEQPPGRWPANVALAHADGCRRLGTERVRGDGHFPAARPASGYGSNVPDSNGGGLRGQDGLTERHLTGEVVERWECVEGCPVRLLDEQSGELVSGANPTRRGSDKFRGVYGDFVGQEECAAPRGIDKGGASRFFYTAKASSAERNAGLDSFEARKLLWSSGEQNPGSFQANGPAEHRNHHPTVKPIELMRWLIRLVTPPGGTVLDPFTGSGTTGIAAVLEGFDFVGVEREPDYVVIAQARIGWWEAQPAGIGMDDALEGDARRRKVADSGQASLFG